MALYWPEARVAIVSEEGREQGGERDYPPEVVVVSLRAGQEECPEFVSGVRELVESRTMAQRCQKLESLYELGTTIGAPEGTAHTEGEDASEAARAEERLCERLRASWGDLRSDEGDDEGERDDEGLWEWGPGLAGGGTLGSLTHVGEWGAPETRIVINHCDEVVVSR